MLCLDRKLEETKPTNSPTLVVGKDFNHYVLITPNVLSGIILGLLMIFILYIGISWLNDIQTPLSYANAPPPKGKEY